MTKSQKWKNINAFVLLVIFSLTIGHSAFSSEMSISKLIADVRLHEDARITNVSVVSSSDGGMNSLDYDKDSILGNVNLKSMNSTVTLEVEITNFGNVAIGIESHTGSAKNLIYPISGYEEKTILCDNSNKCTLGAITKFNITIGYDTYDAVTKNHEFKIDFVFKKINKITYTNIANNNYPNYIMDGNNLVVTFTSDIPEKIEVYSDGILVDKSKYSYINGILTIPNVTSNIEVKKYKEPFARLVSGKIDEVGSEVCIKDECFYIVSNDGTTVTMLAKYNLYVGGIYKSSGWTAYGDEATGLQDPTMLGVIVGNSKRNGTTAFSNNDINYSGSIVASYVNDYKKYFETNGIFIKNARLITKEELETLGCIATKTSCTNAAPWVYLTSYWTESKYDTDAIWYVHTAATFADEIYNVNNRFGVRPVIEISVDDIYVGIKPKVASGDYDTVGSEICINEECFYVISSTEDTVTMLAKYNLLVGNIRNKGAGIIPLSNPTGIQSETAKGYNWDNLNENEIYPFIGMTAFSSDSQKGPNYNDYDGSIVKIYVDDYLTYLEGLGANIEEARLITKEELETLGCVSNGGWTCGTAPNWVYSTSYWVNSKSEFDRVMYVFTYKDFSYDDYYIYDSYGVRPVITISKSEF